MPHITLCFAFSSSNAIDALLGRFPSSILRWPWAICSQMRPTNGCRRPRRSPFGCARSGSTISSGQEQILGEQSALRLAIAEDRVGSSILYGPPGSGKTTLARVIANTTGAYFEELSAVSATVSQVREVIAGARERLGAHAQRTILFLDEIHRFNKAQQDALLPAVEEGILTLIGATTENPYFEVNSALLSRSQIYELEPLSDDGARARSCAAAPTSSEPRSPTRWSS